MLNVLNKIEITLSYVNKVLIKCPVQMYTRTKVLSYVCQFLAFFPRDPPCIHACEVTHPPTKAEPFQINL